MNCGHITSVWNLSPELTWVRLTPEISEWNTGEHILSRPPSLHWVLGPRSPGGSRSEPLNQRVYSESRTSHRKQLFVSMTLFCLHQELLTTVEHRWYWQVNWELCLQDPHQCWPPSPPSPHSPGEHRWGILWGSYQDSCVSDLWPPC